jgi:hypothetical protein
MNVPQNPSDHYTQSWTILKTELIVMRIDVSSLSLRQFCVILIGAVGIGSGQKRRPALPPMPAAGTIPI